MHDPRRLLTFRAVVAAGSFSAAARALSLTQPAVSQQVAALEREVGAQLLDRGTGGARSPQPTEAGRLLLAHADALAERLAQADAQMAELRQEEEVLRIGAFASALGVLVPRAVAAMGGVRVNALQGREAEVRAGVASGALHVGVAFDDADAPVADDPGVERHEILIEPFAALVGPGHPLAGRQSVRLAELAGDTWTAPSTTGLVVRACAAAGFEPDVAYVARDPLAIQGLVAGGLAVTLTPSLLAGDLQGVRVIPLRGAPPRRTVFALTPRVGPRPVATAFVEALRASARPR
ncbi:MAG: LysR family transcriptional regulator [Solirubrobacteraceae bacterium]